MQFNCLVQNSDNWLCDQCTTNQKHKYIVIYKLDYLSGICDECTYWQYSKILLNNTSGQTQIYCLWGDGRNIYIYIYIECPAGYGKDENDICIPIYCNETETDSSYCVRCSRSIFYINENGDQCLANCDVSRQKQLVLKFSSNTICLNNCPQDYVIKYGTNICMREHSHCDNINDDGFCTSCIGSSYYLTHNKQYFLYLDYNVPGFGEVECHSQLVCLNEKYGCIHYHGKQVIFYGNSHIY